ncbi:GntR family transcriptional regulator [Nonomuraea sp. NPDC049480]|uniref:GntR family transcriptional regulator n=1 Tax=Nonomuraea sp. NPDC049480 TaxID=3364353 RepID=UPI003799F508
MTGWEEHLSAARPALERAGTAELVASILRENIIEGSLPPGIRLSEEAIGQVLKVSRNTLREAFRLLSHENLLVHELHRGMFVRRLTASDVADIYRTRRALEAAACGRRAGPPRRCCGRWYVRSGKAGPRRTPARRTGRPECLDAVRRSRERPFPPRHTDGSASPSA